MTRLVVNRGLAVFVLLLSPALGTAQHQHGTSTDAQRIGTVVFENSGGADAQRAFLRGLALLHSYEYVDARAAFREAQAADPGFAMAYWLEALAWSQFDWSIEDLPAARAVLARLGATPEARLARAALESERALGRAIERFLADDPPLVRARRFAADTRAWLDRAPGDPEALAFATRGALYVVRYAPADERVARAEDAIGLAERIVAANPDHPGGAHYLIHATDSPAFAARGLEAARVYDRIAPDVEHALHMPSHIFLQLGMWDEVVASNERSWAASEKWVARGNHSAADLGWHSLLWLQYGYLQQGRFAAARDVIALAEARLATVVASDLERYPDARFALETLRFQLAQESGAWESYQDLRAGTVAEQMRAARSPREKGMVASAAHHRAVAALLTPGSAAQALPRLAEMRAAAAALRDQDPARLQLRRGIAQIEALMAAARGEHDTAAAALREAAATSAESNLAPVGPPSLMPFQELLGRIFHDAGRSADSAAAYTRALQERPNRSAAWLGLARARKAAGDTEGAAEAYRQLLINWAQADPHLPALVEARAGAAKVPAP